MNIRKAIFATLFPNTAKELGDLRTQQFNTRMYAQRLADEAVDRWQEHVRGRGRGEVQYDAMSNRYVFRFRIPEFRVDTIIAEPVCGKWGLK